MTNNPNQVTVLFNDFMISDKSEGGVLHQGNETIHLNTFQLKTFHLEASYELALGFRLEFWLRLRIELGLSLGSG